MGVTEGSSDKPTDRSEWFGKRPLRAFGFGPHRTVIVSIGGEVVGSVIADMTMTPSAAREFAATILAAADCAEGSS